MFRAGLVHRSRVKSKRATNSVKTLLESNSGTRWRSGGLSPPQPKSKRLTARPPLNRIHGKTARRHASRAGTLLLGVSPNHFDRADIAVDPYLRTVGDAVGAGFGTAHAWYADLAGDDRAVAEHAAVIGHHRPCHQEQ